MKYCLKEINERELAGFLLSPFERIAYFGDILVQKYPRDHMVDDFYCSKLTPKDSIKVGCILYKQNEIIMDETYLFKSDIVNDKPFVSIDQLRDEFKEMALDKVDEAKINRLQEIKSSLRYKELYDYYKESYFDSLVFSLLGTSDVKFEIKKLTYETIENHFNNIANDKFIDSEMGLVDLINPFIDKLIHTSNFIKSEILISELRKETEEYVAAGKFSKRELVLIDYLEKTKSSGALSFFVTSTKGVGMICKNIVDYEGRVISKDGKMLMMDIEDIATVKHDGKIIYTKKVI